MRDTQTSDYGRALKTRCWVFGGLAAVGLAVIAAAALLGGSPASHAEAFYWGLGFGLLTCGLALLIRTRLLLARPERWRQARVRETDEREQRIALEAARFAGVALVFLITAAALVLVLVDWHMSLLLVGLGLAYFILFLAARRWLSRRV